MIVQSVVTLDNHALGLNMSAFSRVIIGWALLGGRVGKLAAESKGSNEDEDDEFRDGRGEEISVELCVGEIRDGLGI
ncbi:hypothetical protein Csa_015430 [Cucumis sativus]|uniref:Uncharacterized protein n=1 Tax=Cucumis sativus TaxID=3659 RepID=A0A0A0K3I5_CUCSA|nr:hypothetical protein Csa_015430 [Cucumis sativus]